MKSEMFKLDFKDVSKALVMAVIGGCALPILAAIQTPGFDIFTADWHSILNLALNGGIAAFVSYLFKEFFSNSQGQVFGKIG